MLQMVMKSGDKEQVLDLVEVPELVLVQSCNMILRHQDLRNPDAQYMLQEFVGALKVKAREDLVGPAAFNRHDLKKYITQIDDLLKQFDQK